MQKQEQDKVQERLTEKKKDEKQRKKKEEKDMNEDEVTSSGRSMMRALEAQTEWKPR